MKKKTGMKRRTFGALTAGAVIAAGGTTVTRTAQAADKILKFVQNGNMPVLDPIWTTAYVTRTHGYFIYDTLFSMDANNEVKPQMVDKYDVSADKTLWTFTLRDGLEWHDGTPVTSEDCIPSIKRWGARDAMGLKLMDFVSEFKAVDAKTFTMKLKEPYGLVLESLGKPSSNVPFIMPKKIAETDPFKQIDSQMGSGPFKFSAYEIGQSIKGTRNPDYYHAGQPYLDGFVAIFAAKQSVRVDAIRADRAVTEFRGMPPSARDELVKELGDKVTVQTSDWNCVNLLTPNQKKKPFDDVKVRRALALAIDQWKGAPALSKIATVHTVGGLVFPGSPLAATKDELIKMSAFSTDMDKARAEAKKLLKEAGAENLKFELMNRNVDQPYKFIATWAIDEWSKIGVKATQKVLPTGPFYEALRSGSFEVAVEFNCQNLVNPLLDVAKVLPRSVYPENYGGYEDPKLIELYNTMLTETDATKQREKMRAFETYALDTQVDTIMTPWWERIIVARSYMKGWKISPSHYINLNLANIWLDK